MRVVVNQFMSLDGVVQAPGGAEEDADGGFAHGGWSMPYFDPAVMGPAVSEGMSSAEALLFGRRTWGRYGGRVARARRRSVRRSDERHQEIRGIQNADERRHDVELDVALGRERSRRRRRAPGP